jgi:hypothetical protein
MTISSTIPDRPPDAPVRVTTRPPCKSVFYLVEPFATVEGGAG